MRIYTRGGDKGKTAIYGGQRVDKDDVRIEANGTLDELNCIIGVVRSLIAPDHEWQQLLFRIQHELMEAMSQVATPSEIRDKNPNKLDEAITSLCEEQIDQMDDAMGGSYHFILPGGNQLSAQLQMARAIARRSERRLWTLNKVDEVPSTILKFINRLSDLFFTMARFEMHQHGDMEEKWKNFLYKRNK